jgi:histidinol-phosphatase
MDLPDLLQLAVDAAQAASQPILAGFRDPRLHQEHKGDGSVVTEADQAAERVLREVLGAGAPHIDILGEEEGFEDRGSELRWVVDPIDGTISFSRGIPLFGTLIGLEERATGKALLGVISLPGLGEVYAGGRGLGVRCNGQAVRVPDVELGQDHRSAIVCAGDPLWFTEAGRAGDHAKVAQLPLMRGYCDCFAHALVLRGAIGASVDPGLAPWDLCATSALVEEAGGTLFTTPSQQPGKTDAILGAPRVVESLLELLGW